MAAFSGLVLRPYQLMCAVCASGGDAGGADPASARILEAIRANPDLPLTLRCNAGEVFAWQDPGPGEDSPGSAEHNLKRDLEILHKLNLFPGSTLPARIILYRLFDRVEDTTGICGYESVTAPAWAGCPAACRERYRTARKNGLGALIPPRTAVGMAEDKRLSLAAMAGAEAVKVRPHILLCSVCQYGGGTRPPFPEDNLPELLQHMFRNKELKIELAPHADWLMCAPCPFRAPALNACVNNKGAGGLSNQMRDLRVLQKLGLVFGSVMNARALYRLLFERIPGTCAICRLDHAGVSVWHTGCGTQTEDVENYEKGKALLLSILKE